MHTGEAIDWFSGMLAMRICSLLPEPRTYSVYGVLLPEDAGGLLPTEVMRQRR